MTHPLVDQLRFTRTEFLRGIAGVSDEDAARHFGPMNSIGWTVGHMAWHEQRCWLERSQGEILIPALNILYAYGAAMSTPQLGDTLAAWHKIILAVDPYLDTLTTELLQNELLSDGKSVGQRIGSGMYRLIYHYWYHIGEIQAARQMLEHGNTPQYVGDLDTQAPYRPE